MEIGRINSYVANVKFTSFSFRFVGLNVGLTCEEKEFDCLVDTPVDQTDFVLD